MLLGLTPVAAGIAFTGDTLFCGGCGALFECSATTLFHSLRRLTNERLRPSTQLFPGHEYTEMLLQAAVQRDPQNKDAKVALETAQTRIQTRTRTRSRTRSRTRTQPNPSPSPSPIPVESTRARAQYQPNPLVPEVEP